jgi:HK97 family phage major capsid protein
MNEDLKKQLDDLTGLIDSKIEKGSKQAIESAVGKMDATLKTEITNLVNKFNEVNKRIDEAEVNAKKGLENKKSKTLTPELQKAFKDGALEGMLKGESSRSTFEVKADMTTGDNFTGEVIPADRVPGYKFDPTRPVHVRQLLPQGSTTSDVVRYVKETAYTNGAAPIAEGGTYPSSDFDMTATDVTVRKIGTILRISEEMLADTPQITSYLSARAPQKLYTQEDAQILYGSGTGNNLSGINTNATAFAAGAFAGTVPGANEFDVLVASANQLALSNYRPDYIMLNPTDFHKILLSKDTSNDYLVNSVYQGLEPTFLGIPVIMNTAITAGTFLIGNFAMGCQLFNRENLSLEFFREDGDNVKEGFVSVRLSERIALATYLPLGFVKGTFSTAITALTPA